MHLPFTPDEFLDVFRRYNLAVWPAQWALVLLAVTAVVLARRGRSNSARWVSGILALLWFWTALAYHLAFFASVNRAAVAFAVAFAAQGLMFAWLAWRGADASYRPPSSSARVLGAALIVYALLLYPTLGYLLGHRYPAAPTFGVPCPTTIYTLGLLAWSNRRPPWWLLGVPLAWTAAATSAAVTLGMTEDFGLLASGVAIVSWLALTRRRATSQPHPVREAATGA